ncbi:hypothetical protein [Methanohalophilus portucalensis]|uniref:hypothetical protein n=1 Tax=Methanohalophilus portucalensis TaxID=39664 RepID=UPI001181FC37|nr:hypothetical protein [Methanohalophilus portucalensis]
MGSNGFCTDCMSYDYVKSVCRPKPKKIFKPKNKPKKPKESAEAHFKRTERLIEEAEILLRKSEAQRKSSK